MRSSSSRDLRRPRPVLGQDQLECPASALYTPPGGVQPRRQPERRPSARSTRAGSIFAVPPSARAGPGLGVPASARNPRLDERPVLDQRHHVGDRGAARPPGPDPRSGQRSWPAPRWSHHPAGLARRHAIAHRRAGRPAPGPAPTCRRPPPRTGPGNGYPQTRRMHDRGPPAGPRRRAGCDGRSTTTSDPPARSALATSSTAVIAQSAVMISFVPRSARRSHRGGHAQAIAITGAIGRGTSRGTFAAQAPAASARGWPSSHPSSTS